MKPYPETDPDVIAANQAEMERIAWLIYRKQMASGSTPEQSENLKASEVLPDSSTNQGAEEP